MSSKLKKKKMGISLFAECSVYTLYYSCYLYLLVTAAAVIFNCHEEKMFFNELYKQHTSLGNPIRPQIDSESKREEKF